MRPRAAVPAMRGLALLLALLLLSGCGGWRLRGMPAAGADAAAIPPLRLAGDVATPFGRALEAALREAGLLADDPAAPVLVVGAVESRRRTASVTGNVEAAEFELIERATVELVGADGAVQVAPTELRADRVYRYDQQAVVASSEEQALLRTELRADLVRQVFALLAAAAREA